MGRMIEKAGASDVLLPTRMVPRPLHTAEGHFRPVTRNLSALRQPNTGPGLSHPVSLAANARPLPEKCRAVDQLLPVFKLRDAHERSAK